MKLKVGFTTRAVSSGNYITNVNVEIKSLRHAALGAITCAEKQSSFSEPKMSSVLFTKSILYIGVCEDFVFFSVSVYVHSA